MKRNRSVRSSGRAKRILARFTLLIVILVTVGYLLRLGGQATGRAINGWIAGTTWSELKQIEVVGLKRLIESDILLAADVPDTSNLMRIAMDSLASRVSELPGVRKARAYRRLPGKLVIKVEERIPVAVIAKDKLTLVDSDGATFPQVHVGEVVDLPVFTGSVDPDSDGLNTALEFLFRIKRNYASLYENLGEIRIEDNTVSIRLIDGGAAVRGLNLTEKETLSNLDLFLAERGNELPAGLAYVDMTYLPRIITGTIDN